MTRSGFSRRNEQWVLNAMLRVVGNDILFPGVDAFRVERGYKLADLQRTYARIEAYSVSSKEWERTARRQLDIATDAERRGHTPTARDAYFRAALYLSRAQWSIFADNERKRQLQGECLAAFAKVIAFTTEYHLERVEIPFEGRSLVGHLHLPKGVDRPVPAVLFVPGMDMTKEEFPDVNNNYFVKRGMALLTIDGPGQGESHFMGLKVDATNYDRAGAACFDFLSQRPEIDPERIGVFGVSMGSYWAPSIAAHDPRFKACAGALGCYLQKDTIFNVAQPTFRRRFLYMAGLQDDEEAFDRLAEQMTLEGREDRLRCPTLYATGELDELCPVEDAYRLFERTPEPKELWVFEGEFHPMGGVIADMLPAIADWMQDALNGQLAPNHSVNRFFEKS